jgi:hypothetical protein
MDASKASCVKGRYPTQSGSPWVYEPFWGQISLVRGGGTEEVVDDMAIFGL